MDRHLRAFGNRLTGDLVASVLAKLQVTEPVWKMNWQRSSLVLQRPWLEGFTLPLLPRPGGCDRA